MDIKFSHIKVNLFISTPVHLRVLSGVFILLLASLILAKNIEASTELNLSPEEQKWLAENPAVTFTGDPNWLPYEAFQPDGSYIGIVAEHLKLITDSTGLKFKMSPSKTWTESTEKAKQGQVDVLSETDDSDLSSHLDFTIPYVSNPIIIAMSSKENYVENINKIKDKKIALIRDYGYAAKIRRKYSDINFVTVENIQDGLSKVSTGVIDALLCTHALCSYTISGMGLNDVRIVGKTEFDTKLALGVQNNLHQLKSILNKAIAKITPSQQQAIFDKWIESKYVEKVDYTLLYQIVAVTVVLVIFFIFWNRRLEHKVRERTRELTAARDEAQLANRSKSIFLSRMSHELRTPLNAILGFSQVLQLNPNNDFTKDDLDSINEIISAGDHLLELINEILDLSQIETGNLKLKIENTDLTEIIDESVALIKSLAKKSNIDISYPDNNKDIFVTVDRVRIKQIIINLLANAVKYNNKNGKIEISYGTQNNNILLSVKDTGIGIADEFQEHVFEPFERLGAKSTDIEGTGIGLALSRKLIHLMDGDIGFNSTENKGSTFWIEMKTGVKESSQDTVNKAEHKKNISDKNYSILYVEDNPANLRLVSRLLSKIDGITLYDAPNGSVAIDLLSAPNTFNLILLDIELPGDINGYDILKKIRNNSANADIPVIAVSANATEHDINKGLNAGFDEYITKPINVKNFMKVIHSYLK